MSATCWKARSSDSGDQVRVTAQLIEADRGTHLWSERWDRPATDVFAVQTEVAEQVATRLAASGGAIPEAERAASRRARPEDLKAYDLYLLGQEAMGHFTKESIEEAIRLLEQAVDQDPKLARAWAALAAAHDLTMHYGADADAARAAAMQAIRRGLELDPQDAAAHATLGHILGMAGDLPRAKAEFETALRLNPSDAGILTNYAGWASTFGDPERGAQAADRAMRLNPNYSVSAAGFFRLAYLMAGRYEDALRLVEREDPQTRTRGGWVQAGRDLCGARPSGGREGSGPRNAQAPSRPHDRELCPRTAPATATPSGSGWSRGCSPPASRLAPSLSSCRPCRHQSTACRNVRRSLHSRPGGFSHVLACLRTLMLAGRRGGAPRPPPVSGT